MKIILVLVLLVTTVSVNAQAWQKIDLKMDLDVHSHRIFVRAGKTENSKLWLLDNMGSFIVSLDDGATWIRPPAPYAVPNAMGAFFLNETHAWIVGSSPEEQPADARSGSIWSTSDMRDRKFLAVLTMFGKGSLHDAYFFDWNHGIAVGEAFSAENSGGVIYRTADGGRSWRIVWSRPDEKIAFLNRVIFVDKNVGFAIGDRAILKTDDRGASWTEVYKSGDANLFAIAHTDKGSLIAVGGWGYVVRSIDLGRTWKRVAGPDDDDFLLGVSCAFGKCFAVGRCRREERAVALRSDDDGQTWSHETLDLNGSLWDVLVTKKIVLAVGEDAMAFQLKDDPAK